LPIAREAHKRLQFTNVHPQQENDRVVAAGEANEKPSAGPDELPCMGGKCRPGRIAQGWLAPCRSSGKNFVKFSSGDALMLHLYQEDKIKIATEFLPTRSCLKLLDEQLQQDQA
jgi:hypothetical protein